MSGLRPGDTWAGRARSANARALSPIAGCCGGVERHTLVCVEPVTKQKCIVCECRPAAVCSECGARSSDAACEKCGRTFPATRGSAHCRCDGSFVVWSEGLPPPGARSSDPAVDIRAVGDATEKARLIVGHWCDAFSFGPTHVELHPAARKALEDRIATELWGLAPVTMADVRARAYCSSTFRDASGAMHRCTLRLKLHEGDEHEELQEDGSSFKWRSLADDDDLVPVRLGQPDVERERARIVAAVCAVIQEEQNGDGWVPASLIMSAIAPREDERRGVSAPNPEAGPADCPQCVAGVPHRHGVGVVIGRRASLDADGDDDDRGWTVNGRPVSPRDVDHGNESENPWTVNGAPIPAAFDHAECKATLERERERYRRALGLLVDVSSVARKVVGYVDREAETGR